VLARHAGPGADDRSLQALRWWTARVRPPVRPWIHLADWVRLVLWVLATDSLTGPVNAVGPNPVTNAAFAHALGACFTNPAASGAGRRASSCARRDGRRVAPGEPARCARQGHHGGVCLRVSGAGACLEGHPGRLNPQPDWRSAFRTLRGDGRVSTLRASAGRRNRVHVRQVRFLEPLRKGTVRVGVGEAGDGASRESKRSSVMTADNSAPMPSVLTSSCTMRTRPVFSTDARTAALS